MKGIVNALKFTISITNNNDVEIKSIDNTNFLILLKLLDNDVKPDLNIDHTCQGIITCLIGKHHLKKILKLYPQGKYNAKTYNENIVKIANSTYSISIPYMNELLVSDKYIVGCEGVKFDKLPSSETEQFYEATLNVFTVKITDDTIYSSMVNRLP